MTKTLPAPFGLSEQAKTYLQSALAAAPDKQGVRIATKTAGCSGLKYQFALVPAPQPGDLVAELGGIRFFVDLKAEMYLLGATLDYVVVGLNRELDFVANPNEAARCGCGESFTPIKKPTS
jgi:iron-sulfur cluster assembly protein